MGHFSRELTKKGATPLVNPPTGPSSPAGYEPDLLDPALAKHLEVVTTAIEQVRKLGPRVEEALNAIKGAESPDGVLDTADKTVSLYYKLSQAALNVTKATDELTRLRSFLAGGPDSRPDLTVRGEIELRGIVLQAVKQLGLKVVDAETLEEIE